MRPFIILIGILVLCDSIARKSGDYRNKQLYNLKNDEFKEIIRSTLLKTAISQLRKFKVDVINHLEIYLDGLPSFKQGVTLGIGRPSRRGNWGDLRTGLRALVNNNTSNKYLKVLEETVQKIMEF